MITEAGEFHPPLDEPLFFPANGDDLLFPSHHHHHGQESTLLPDTDDDLLLSTSTHSAPGCFFPSIPEHKELSLQPLSLIPHSPSSYHHHHHTIDGFHQSVMKSTHTTMNNNANLSSSPSSALDFTTMATTTAPSLGGGMMNGAATTAPLLSTSAVTTPTASGSNSPMIAAAVNSDNNNNNTGSMSFMDGNGLFNHFPQQSHMFMAPSQRGVPRVSSMPNMRLNTYQTTATDNNTMPALGAPTMHKSGSAVDLRRQAAANRHAMPRSQSAIELSKTGSGTRGGTPTARQGVNVPHQQFLTPSHLRKGKGGRQPAADPRLDPKIDPKKARRILANRLSAARSKLKQKSQIEVLRQRVEGLKAHKEGLMLEIKEMAVACDVEEQKRAMLMQDVLQLESLLNNSSNNNNGSVDLLV